MILEYYERKIFKLLFESKKEIYISSPWLTEKNSYPIYKLSNEPRHVICIYYKTYTLRRILMFNYEQSRI